MSANGFLHPVPRDRQRQWPPLRFSPCECGPTDLVRLRRPGWLRWLVPSRRLYQCPHCGVKVFYGR